MDFTEAKDNRFFQKEEEIDIKTMTDSYSLQFDGTGSFEGFWMQFSIYAERNCWDNYDKVCYFLIALRNQALEYSAHLPIDIRTNIEKLYSSMKWRFGDNETPGMCRLRLRNVSKSEDESIQEYVCRVEIMVRKSFPGIDNNLLVKLTTEYALSGYTDSSVALNVMIKQPVNIGEIIEEMYWQELCKETFRKDTGNSKQHENLNSDFCKRTCETTDLHCVSSIKKVRTSVKKIKCSKCKERGHVRRTCPKIKLIDLLTVGNRLRKCITKPEMRDKELTSGNIFSKELCCANVKRLKACTKKFKILDSKQSANRIRRHGVCCL